MFLQEHVLSFWDIIKEDKILLDPQKVQDILDMEEPNNVSELRRFLGMVNYITKYM